MKRLFNYLFFVMLWLSCVQLSAQTIDLNTGIDDNTGQLFPNGVNDDTWQATWYNGTPAGPWFPAKVGYAYTFANQDPAVKWVQFGFIGNPNWDQINTPHPWTSYVKTSFYLASCNVQSAQFEFDQIGADDNMDQIIVNSNTPHVVNFSFGPTPTTTNTLTNNVTINIPTGEIVQGWNTIMFRVQDMSAGGGSSHGLILHGRLKLQSTGYLDFSLKDINGIKKSEYCLEEDVFIYGSGVGATAGSYGLELYDITGGGNTLVSSLPSNTGTPVGINITTKFQAAGVIFIPNKTYRVKLKVSSPCNLEMYKDFTYKCCASSVDASFWVNTTNGTLQVQGPGKGTHVWSIYSIPPVSNGKYVWLKNFYTPTFNYDGINMGGCYYVVHTITNGCGTACTAQVVCKSECGEKQCNMSKPTDLISGQTNNLLTWSQVPGAIYYTIEINPYDPRCCPPADPNAPMIYYPSKYYNVYDEPHFVWNPDEIFIYEGPIHAGGRCFSWRVTAHCPDGGQTVSDYGCSWYDGSIDPPHDPAGLIGDKPADNGTGNQKENGDVLLQNATKELKGTAVNVFPNPSKGSVSIDLTAVNDIEFSINIYDISGKMVRFYEHLKTTNKKSTVKLQETLSKGTYIIKIITSDNQVIDRKLVIE
jgi:hypothetical protein